MKFYLFITGTLAVLSHIHADCVQEVIEAKPHDITNLCTGEENWSLLSHPHDCHKFFVCANYIPEEFQCEPHYYFDEIEKRCIRGSCNAIEKCQSWVRAVGGDCTAFEICENNAYTRYACTDDHYFNAELGMCQKIEQTPQHLCSCVLPQYSLIENSNQCNSYYKCINGLATLQQCPKGAYFDRRLNTCIIDLLGKCVTAPTMTTEENAMLETCERLGMGSDENDEIIFVADTEKCEKFYMCLNGRVFAKECPIGFYYDREAQYCEYDSYGICEAMLEQAEHKKEQEEKEASEHEIQVDIQEQNHNEILEPLMPENPPKPPVHVSLSYTHLKLEADKGNVMEPPTQEHKDNENGIEIMHTDDILHIPPVPPIRLGHQQPAKKINSETATLAKNEFVETEGAEVSEHSFVNKKPQIVHAQLKLPGNSAYDKLSSKFMVFEI